MCMAFLCRHLAILAASLVFASFRFSFCLHGNSNSDVLPPTFSPAFHHPPHPLTSSLVYFYSAFCRLPVAHFCQRNDALCSDSLALDAFCFFFWFLGMGPGWGCEFTWGGVSRGELRWGGVSSGLLSLLLISVWFAPLPRAGSWKNFWGGVNEGAKENFDCMSCRYSKCAYVHSEKWVKTTTIVGKINASCVHSDRAALKC